MIQRTFVMLKPDTVQRNLVGEIIGRFEKRGLKIAALKLIRMSRGKAKELYAAHKGKDFYEPLLKFVTSGPCVVCVIEGPEAIRAIRHMLGTTNPLESDAGSIRGDYGLFTRRNVVHASDSPKTAESEMGMFFEPGEILDYKKSDEEWVYEH